MNQQNTRRSDLWSSYEIEVRSHVTHIHAVSLFAHPYFTSTIVRNSTFVQVRTNKSVIRGFHNHVIDLFEIPILFRLHLFELDQNLTPAYTDPFLSEEFILVRNNQHRLELMIFLVMGSAKENFSNMKIYPTREISLST